MRAAQPAQRRPGALRRTVFLNQVEPRQGNVELRGFCEFEQHELACGVCLGEFFQSLVLGDAVFDMHDIVAHDEIAKVGKERRRGGRLLCLWADRFEVGEEINR